MWLDYAGDRFDPMLCQYTADALRTDDLALVALVRALFPGAVWDIEWVVAGKPTAFLQLVCSRKQASGALLVATRKDKPEMMRMARRIGARNYAAVWLECFSAAGGREHAACRDLLERWIAKVGKSTECVNGMQLGKRLGELAAEEERLRKKQQRLAAYRKTIDIILR